MNITNGDIVLRSLEFADKFNIAEYCNKKIWDNLRDFIPNPYTLYDAENFIRMSRVEDPPCTFAIEYKKEFVGIISLVVQADVYRLNAELGYWIGEQFWGNGIISKAIPLIVNYGFEELGLNRVYAHVFDFNIPSQRVLLKSGFKMDYIAKNAVLKNGLIIDEYRYSMLKAE
ncbi:MAG: GNAT family protein [Bacteroidota bacterium]|jgi:RimJ/RimL family protein N-acetyltransferase